jgi:O-succinylbenzoate synthase
MGPLDTPLEIAGCRLFEVAVPLREPFRISGGALRARRSLIVEVTERGGAVGYGESAPFERPFYSEETLYSAKACIIQHLVPRLTGRAFPSLREAAHALERGVRGNRIARAGVETALWDLVCAMAGVSLRSLLGAAMMRLGVPERQRRSLSYVESGIALGIPDDGGGAALGGQAVEALRQGYKRVKVKVQPGWDVAAVRAVRQAARVAGLKVRVWADANGAFDRSEHFEALQALDREQLVLLEQPLPPEDVLGIIRLCQEMITPICLDESLTDDHAGELFLASSGPRVWNLKVQRVGGLWESLKLYKRAVEADVRLWAGSMPETGIGAHPILCLASFAGFVYPTDVQPSARWYAPGADLIEWRMDDEGRISVSDVPGLARLRLKDKLEQAGKVVA